MDGQRGSARLMARPSEGPSTTAVEGPRLRLLRVGAYPAYLVSPPEMVTGVRIPLIVVLHGAGGSSREGLELLAWQVKHAGVVVLAPESTGGTWDAIHGRFGPDVAAINDALNLTFATTAIDPTRICLAGLSDGASYALGLGLANGDLFTHVVAFSPGFVPQAEPAGSPSVFISHGTDDGVLPIDVASRRIVPALRERGLVVDYLEFEGGHIAPEAMRQAAFDWFLGHTG
jgi:predicted esterase